MDSLGHQAKRGNIPLVPDPLLDIGREIRAGMDLGFLGADHGPAALGFHAAHRRLGLRPQMAKPAAMRHLVKPVLRRDRADLDRLEQVSSRTSDG